MPEPEQRDRKLIWSVDRASIGLMIEVGVYEAKTRFSQLIKRVEEGETIVVKRRDNVVPRLVPDEVDLARHRRRAIEKIKALRPSFAGMTLEKILAARDGGRK